MKLDRSMLPEGVSFGRKEGLYAELGPAGQVLHLGVYQNGRLKPDSWYLDVAPDGSSARAQLAKTIEWPEPRDENADEEAEEPSSLLSFARTWIERVADGMKDRINLSCAFCGKSQQEVKKLIAGPSVFICDECITLCNDIITEENLSQE